MKRKKDLLKNLNINQLDFDNILKIEIKNKIIYYLKNLNCID